MTCASALEFMLDADPAELTQQAETPLAAHLRGCARCARAANLIVMQTAQIGRAPVAVDMVSPQSFVRRRRVRHVAIGIAATALAAIGLARFGGVPTATAPAETAVAPERTGPAPRVDFTAAEPATQLAAVIASNLSVAGLVRVEAVAEKATTAPVRPGPARSAQNVVQTDGISVAPPAGTRATIFTTRDPNITVVWLQADDTNRSPR